MTCFHEICGLRRLYKAIDYARNVTVLEDCEDNCTSANWESWLRDVFSDDDSQLNTIGNMVAGSPAYCETNTD